MFVGKDFLSRRPPPNYIPGVGRGAVPFSTTAERAGTATGSAAHPNFLQKRGHNDAKATSSTDPRKLTNAERFQDPDEEADDIYSAIEKRRQRKRRPVSKSNDSSPLTAETTKVDNDREKLATVSIDEWAQMPEAQDATFSHRRAREKEQNLKRHYLVEPQKRKEGEALVLGNSAKDSVALGTRETLQTMIRAQPTNFRGYIALAQLEETELRISVARKIAARGCAKIPSSEELWVLNIRLHSQSEAKLSGSTSREIAKRAVQMLPSSEKLWLQLIELEETKAAKLRWVHDALSQPLLTNSERLWLLAASFEPETAMKSEILDTALQFADTPAIWLELVKALPEKNDQLSTLARARQSHPSNEQLWLQSVETDPKLADQAVSSLPREFWLTELRTSQLGMVILPFLRPTREEFSKLKDNPANWDYLALCEDVGDVLVTVDPSLATKAVELYPHNVSIWQSIIDTKSPEELAKLLRATSATPPSLVVPLIANKLEAGQFRDEWLNQQPCESPELWELNCSGDLNTILEGIRKWPHHAQFYVLRAQLISDKAEAQLFLKNNLARVSDAGPLWLALASLESSIVRKRAILTQATTELPRNSQLWIARIALEEQQKSPLQYLVSEALNHHPEDPELWVVNLRISPVSSRKKLLGEALKATKMSAVILNYGAQFFESLKLMDKAQQWREMARKSKDRAR